MFVLCYLKTHLIIKIHFYFQTLNPSLHIYLSTAHTYSCSYQGGSCQISLASFMTKAIEKHTWRLFIFLTTTTTEITSDYPLYCSFCWGLTFYIIVEQFSSFENQSGKIWSRSGGNTYTVMNEFTESATGMTAII